MFRFHSVCLILVLCSPALCMAQQSAAQPAATPAPATVAEEGRIKLDVMVTDKSGKPVTGLDLKDFTLLEDNQPGKILSFHAIAPTAQPAGPPVQVILVIDAVNVTAIDGVDSERSQIDKFLSLNGGHLAQPVSIIGLTNDGLKVLVQPSTDGNAIAKQLDQASSVLRPTGKPAGAAGGIGNFQVSVDALTTIVKSAATDSGRKLLIWVGSGWPLLDTMQASPEAKQNLFLRVVDFSTLLREGHMSAYSVSLGAFDMNGSLYEAFLKGIKTPDKVGPPNLNLKVLAVQSGGRVLGPNNDLVGQIRTCIQDASAYYTLTFDPKHADKPNEYHDLKVRVSQSGQIVRTNSGYYNQP
jgi:VWFA-related protein